MQNTCAHLDGRGSASCGLHLKRAARVLTFRRDLVSFCTTPSRQIRHNLRMSRIFSGSDSASSPRWRRDACDGGLPGGKARLKCGGVLVLATLSKKVKSATYFPEADRETTGGNS
ncbi:hypothetical protein EYF80_049577 [Liparis tanakae]|uniref:Uncharacterized protein n=1 Tax=Liparis tanakae TaxID=230148 RepID=A0A4Z2FHL4_9TELE|nr:hypothetical protein EYF80_049577 [Liparis tanakae]